MLENKYIIIALIIWVINFLISFGIQPLRKIFIKNLLFATIYGSCLLGIANYIDGIQSIYYLFLGLLFLTIHSVLLLIYLLSFRLLKKIK